MDDTRKSFREIEPLDESELETDLKFLYHNRSDTSDQFVEEAIPVIKYHVNQVMASYQEKLLDELTEYMRGEIAGIILRVRRETIYHPEQTIGRDTVVEEKSGDKNELPSW